MPFHLHLVKQQHAWLGDQRLLPLKLPKLFLQSKTRTCHCQLKLVEQLEATSTYLMTVVGADAYHSMRCTVLKLQLINPTMTIIFKDLAA